MIRRDGPTPTGRQHLAALRGPLDALEASVDRIDTWALVVSDCLSAGGRLLAVGNGGSAAQAQHFTSELVGRYRHERQAVSAIALGSDSSTLTALANDYPPEFLFARQVAAHGRPGDVLVALSASGACRNIVAAVETARANQMTVFALTGPEPNLVANAATDAVCVASPYAATVQEVHLVALHLLCAAVDAALVENEPSTVEVGAP